MFGIWEYMAVEHSRTKRTESIDRRESDASQLQAGNLRGRVLVKEARLKPEKNSQRSSNLSCLTGGVVLYNSIIIPSNHVLPGQDTCMLL